MDDRRHSEPANNVQATAKAVLLGNRQASVHREKQSTMTRTYRLPFGVVTDMSRRPMATRSHWWPTSTCPMGARRGQGDFRAKHPSRLESVAQLDSFFPTPTGPGPTLFGYPAHVFLRDGSPMVEKFACSKPNWQLPRRLASPRNTLSPAGVSHSLIPDDPGG